LTEVHPTAMVGDGVELGERVRVGPHVVLLGPAEIGDDCWIGPSCVIGTPPEIAGLEHNSWSGVPLESPGVRIGAGTVIRELSTIHQGSHRTTTVGAGCWLLNRVYVAHDCLVGDEVTLSAGTSLGGHVEIGDRANLGMNVVVHQRRVIGPGTMVGMGSAVTRDVPPHAIAYGNPARLNGVNVVGMRRAAVPDEHIDELQRAYASGVVPAVPPASLAPAFEWWAVANPAKPLGRRPAGVPD
jgi:UDP-N-acetylglucosamine acyltransferase